MLVFSRTLGQSLMVGDEIEVQIVEIRGDKVRLGIVCPSAISVHRQEVFDLLARQDAPHDPSSAQPPQGPPE